MVRQSVTAAAVKRRTGAASCPARERGRTPLRNASMRAHSRPPPIGRS